MIKYSKIRNVKTPSRGKNISGDRSAGIDFYVPSFDEQFIEDLRQRNSKVIGLSTTYDRIQVPPHSHILIPSGIKCNLQCNQHYLYDQHNGIALIAFNKSSIGIKQLDVAATVIDEDYQGELHISLTNTSAEWIDIEYDSKIVQFVLIPIVLADFVQVDSSELFDCQSARCEGNFGSTD